MKQTQHIRRYRSGRRTPVNIGFHNRQARFAYYIVEIPEDAYSITDSFYSTEDNAEKAAEKLRRLIRVEKIE